MMRFDTREISAGILYSPSDCRNPTKENASPTKITMGNIRRVRGSASLSTSSESSGAISRTSDGAKITPITVMPAVTSKMRLT